jgi:hypothetical protein
VLDVAFSSPSALIVSRLEVRLAIVVTPGERLTA